MSTDGVPEELIHQSLNKSGLPSPWLSIKDHVRKTALADERTDGGDNQLVRHNALRRGGSVLLSKESFTVLKPSMQPPAIAASSNCPLYAGDNTRRAAYSVR